MSSATVVTLKAGEAPTPPVTSKPAERGPRYGFVDLLRGFALIVMIETHVVNAYLPAGERHTPFFFWLAFFNGLVAPSFLFAAGFSIVLQANRLWDDWLHFRLPFWKQMRRLGFIGLVAYYTHLQRFNLTAYLHLKDPGVWAETLQVDILQCIVVSLLAVHLLILATRRKERFLWGAGLSAAAAVIVTPLVWARDFRKLLPLPLALYMNPHDISLFPLFPWIGFLLAGCCVCHLFLRAVDGKIDPRFMRYLALAGAILVPAGVLLRSAPYTLPGKADFYTTSPLYVLIRVGCVLLICSLLYWLERYLRWVPGPVRLAGQESLLVYGVHLWVIFALLRGRHLGPVLGLEAGYLGCFALSALIIAFMLYLARHYHSLKANHPRPTKYAQAAIVTLMVVVFLLR